MRIAALQMVARAGDVAANLASIGRAVAEAKTRGAELLVAPELALTGYGASDAIRALAEPREGGQIAAIRRMAGESGLAIVVGFAERTDGFIYNSAILARPDGEASFYRKCHLYGDYERELFAAGNERPKSLDLNGLRIGMLICYDVEFPECVRALALEGVDLVAAPTALPESAHAAFIAEKLVPTRAFENQVAIVYANHAGADRRFAYAGRSSITMPDGSDAARAGPSSEEIMVADFERAHFDASRAANPYLRDRRRDLF